MFEWAQALIYYLYRYVYNQPPTGAVYGYRWQAGQGVPAALTIYDIRSGTVPPGLYVAFTGTILDNTIDYFGTAAGPGPVFPPPAAVSRALSNLVASVARNPPPGEAQNWRNPNQARLLDIDGYLGYVALCLNLVNQTIAGTQLLNALSTTATRTTFITPSAGSNSTRGCVRASMNTLAGDLVAAYRDNLPFPAATIDAAVQAQYAHIGNDQAKYNKLAADMNAAPLYTLFDTAANFQPNYLANHFAYHGAQLAGDDLRTWVGPEGNAEFNTALRGMTGRDADGVIPLEAFLQALTVALLPSTVAANGSGPRVNFFTQNRYANDHGDPGFRPPAIGLAHELVHAWQYTRGTSAGYDTDSYSTTAAELKFTGIGPFAGDPVTENAIRLQWAAVQNLDPSNTWANPAPRLVYRPVLPCEQIQDVRVRYRCI